MRKRDAQSFRVYRSELEVGIGITRNWDTLQECEKYIMKIISHELFPHTIGRDIKVLCHGNRVHAAASRSPSHFGIHLPFWARSKAVVLHELSHIVIHGNLEWHGEDFCDVYLDLLARFERKGLAHKLKEKFIENKVRFTKDSVLYCR